MGMGMGMGMEMGMGMGMGIGMGVGVGLEAGMQRRLVTMLGIGVEEMGTAFYALCVSTLA